jgi:hypothetical protein
MPAASRGIGMLSPGTGLSIVENLGTMPRITWGPAQRPVHKLRPELARWPAAEITEAIRRAVARAPGLSGR